MRINQRKILQYLKGIYIGSKLAFKKTKAQKEKVIQKCIQYGFMLDPRIIDAFSEKDLSRIVELVIDNFKLDANKLTKVAFHKSFNYVMNTPEEKLKLQQLLHYLSSYYFAVYDKEDKLHAVPDTGLVYIPMEDFEVIEQNAKLPLLFVKGFTRKEFTEKLLNLTYANVAFDEAFIEFLVEMIQHFNLEDKIDISQVKARELKIALFEAGLAAPTTADELLRYIVYKATDSTLLINNENTRNAIRSGLILPSVKTSVRTLLKKFFSENPNKYDCGLSFRRRKDLWLTIKEVMDESTKRYINRMSRWAKKITSPETRLLRGDVNVPVNIVTDYTKLILRGLPAKLALNLLQKSNATVQAYVRLYNALNYRKKHDSAPTQFRIRNGRIWKKEEMHAQLNKDAGYFNDIFRISEALKIIKEKIAEKLPSVEDKIFIVPENVEYAFPVSQKMMVGGIPAGTKVHIPNQDDAIIFGVWWKNFDYRRIDLDLSTVFADENGNVNFVSWYSYHKHQKLSIAFSGDVTNAPAPNGAAEFIIIRNIKNIGGTEAQGAMMLNDYTGHINDNLPFKFFVQHVEAKTAERIYQQSRDGSVRGTGGLVVKGANLILKDLYIPRGSHFMTLCFWKLDASGLTIYFYPIAGTKRISTSADYKMGYELATDAIPLKEILSVKNAKIIHSKEEIPEDFEGQVVDLSLINVDDSTFIENFLIE